MKIEDIIKGCKSHELRAQRLLYDKYSRRLYPICIRYCKDEQSASAALHSGFLKIYQNIKQLTDVGKIESWMSRIIVHASIDQIKVDKKFTFVTVEDSHIQYRSSEHIENKLTEKYLPLLNQLPEGYRLVFNMRVLEEMKHKEIAKVLDITESTSRSQFLKAKSMLKKIIENNFETIQ